MRRVLSRPSASAAAQKAAHHRSRQGFVAQVVRSARKFGQTDGFICRRRPSVGLADGVGPSTDPALGLARSGSVAWPGRGRARPFSGARAPPESNNWNLVDRGRRTRLRSTRTRHRHRSRRSVRRAQRCAAARSANQLELGGAASLGTARVRRTRGVGGARSELRADAHRHRIRAEHERHNTSASRSARSRHLRVMRRRREAPFARRSRRSVRARRHSGGSARRTRS